MRRLVPLLCLSALLVSPAGAHARAPLDVRLFAHVPSPGAPEGVSIGPDGRVYTASLNAEGNGTPHVPSKVFAYSRTGKLLRTYTIKGQNLNVDNHGLTGLAFDAEGRLYVGDLSPPRVIRLDPRTGRQSTYATMRDLKPCAQAPGKECSLGVRDFPAWPDYLSFAPDGSLYEPDSLQGLIWRIPKGGGRAQVWFRDPRLVTEIGSPVFGPSAMELAPDHRTLYFTTVGQAPGTTTNAAAGRVWRIPIGPGDRPGEMTSFWESQPADGPGGIAFGRSGKVYVAQSGSNQIVILSKTGQELKRAPDPVSDNLLPVPVDSPLGVAFDGTRLLVANSSFLTHTPNNWALLDVYAGETGVPEIRPRVSSADAGCARARGHVKGRRLGPVRLGWTRAHVRRTLPRRRTRASVDRFCLAGGGSLRAGYGSRRLPHRVRGRAVLLLSSSRHYRLVGIRPGARLTKKVRRRLRHARRFRVGSNRWYLARGRGTRRVFRVHGRRVAEVGIAATSLTHSRRAARRFLVSFR